MVATSHRDVHLLFEPAGDRFRVIVLEAPVRPPAPRTFALPFVPFELDALSARLAPRPRGSRLVDAPDTEVARAIGGKLFDAVFDAELGACLEASLAAARATGTAGIRLRLQLAACPELTGLPWELLYDRHRDTHLALSVESPVVRTLGLPDTEPSHRDPLALDGPLRILVMAANPGDHAALDVERESALITAALAPAVERGAVVVDRAAGGSLAALAGKLRRGGGYHVLHYIGHGGYDRATRDGVLALEDPDAPDGPARLATGRDLAVVLRDHRSLRLVLLNACEGARADGTDPFGGVAATLVRSGIPAAVAMQFAISDDAAVAFAGACYESLAGGVPLDVAVGEARKAVYATGHLTEWATPVVHLRGDDVRLFDAPPEPERTTGTVTAAGAIVGDTSPTDGDRRAPLPSGGRRSRRRRARGRAGAVIPIALATAAVASVLLGRALERSGDDDSHTEAAVVDAPLRLGGRVDLRRVLGVGPTEAARVLAGAGFVVTDDVRRSDCGGNADYVVAVYLASPLDLLAALDPSGNQRALTDRGRTVPAPAGLQLAVEDRDLVARCTTWATTIDPALFGRAGTTTP